MRILTVRIRTLMMAAVLGGALVLGSGLAYATEAAQVWQSGARALPVYSVERTDNKIAISFDCAWGTDHTDAILEHLAASGVCATFFTVQFWAERYPDYLKKRVSGGMGHLSNKQCACAIQDYASDRLHHVWLCHLSEENNHPELARKTVETRLQEFAGKGLGKVCVDVFRRNVPSLMFELE